MLSQHHSKPPVTPSKGARKHSSKLHNTPVYPQTHNVPKHQTKLHTSSSTQPPLPVQSSISLQPSILSSQQSISRYFSTNVTVEPSVSLPQQSKQHWLVIGLGNHGDKYVNTRHNVGKDYIKKMTLSCDQTLSMETADCFHSPPIQLSSLDEDLQKTIILGSNLQDPRKKLNKNNFNKDHETNDVKQFHLDIKNVLNITTTENIDLVPIQPSYSCLPNYTGQDLSLSSFSTASTPPSPSSSLMSVPSSLSTSMTSSPPSSPISQTSKVSSVKKTNKKNSKKQTNNGPVLFTEIPDNITVTFAVTKSFMNNSGSYLANLIKSLRISPDHVIVCHDDLDLSLGKVKIKNNGSSGGQRGIRDILAHLGNDSPFVRLRLGIGRPPQYQEVSDYVLQRFSPQERKTYQYIDKYILTAIVQIILYGSQQANNHLQNMQQSYESQNKEPQIKQAIVKPVDKNVNTFKSNPNINIFDYKF